MTGTEENPLAGPARSEVWDRALLLLAERGTVEPGAVRARVDRDVAPATVREVLAALDERGWLERPDPDEAVWLPGERARAVVDLPTRAPAPADGTWVVKPMAAAVADALA